MSSKYLSMQSLPDGRLDAPKSALIIERALTGSPLQPDRLFTPDRGRAQVWRVPPKQQRLQAILSWIFEPMQVLFLGLLLVSAGAASQPPERVVSINLCTDQMTAALIGPDRIASLSRLIIDPGISQLAANQPRVLDGMVLNTGLSEQILPLNPDLVVAGRYSAQPTVELLRQLGLPLLTLDIAHSLADVRRRLQTLGAALGAEVRAEQLITRFDARLAALRPVVGQPEPQARLRAIYLQPNGYTAGSGSLAGDIIQQAGLRNLGAELGIQGHGKLSLEQVLMAQPELLIIDQRDRRYPSLATEFLSHPAIQALAKRVPQVAIPPRLWICGLPGSLDALALLTDARNAVLAGRTR